MITNFFMSILQSQWNSFSLLPAPSQLLLLFLMSLVAGLHSFIGLIPVKDSGTGAKQLFLKIHIFSYLLAFLVWPKIFFLIGFCFEGWWHLIMKESVSKSHFALNVFLRLFAYGLYLTLLFFAFSKSSDILVGFFSQNILSLKSLKIILGGSFSMLLLGSVIFSMVFGHWYLVTPRLSHQPLVLSSGCIFLFVLLKMILSAASFYNQPQLFWDFDQERWHFDHMIMAILRVSWGFLAIFIFNIFAYKLVKMRSLQSATGIFYAQSFLILAGELVSYYYIIHYGLWL
jgi:hypothetical protein